MTNGFSVGHANGGLCGSVSDLLDGNVAATLTSSPDSMNFGKDCFGTVQYVDEEIYDTHDLFGLESFNDDWSAVFDFLKLERGNIKPYPNQWRHDAV